jgi:hypothetical protein
VLASWFIKQCHRRLGKLNGVTILHPYRFSRGAAQSDVSVWRSVHFSGIPMLSGASIQPGKLALYCREKRGALNL